MDSLSLPFHRTIELKKACWAVCPTTCSMQDIQSWIIPNRGLSILCLETSVEQEAASACRLYSANISSPATWMCVLGISSTPLWRHMIDFPHTKHCPLMETWGYLLVVVNVWPTRCCWMTTYMSPSQLSLWWKIMGGEVNQQLRATGSLPLPVGQ